MTGPGATADAAQTLDDAAGQDGDGLPLAGWRVLVVEDEALIALDLAMTIEEMGASVCGPYGCPKRAAAAAEQADAAILDVDLRGGTVLAVADRLRAAGKPFAFHTGRSDLTSLRSRYGRDVPILRKPSRASEVRDALRALIAARLMPRDRLRRAGGLRLVH